MYIWFGQRGVVFHMSSLPPSWPRSIHTVETFIAYKKLKLAKHNYRKRILFGFIFGLGCFFLFTAIYTIPMNKFEKTL